MGVRIRQWPAQLASRALATLHAEAADGSGWGFAVVYAIYQVVQTGL